MVNPDFDDGPAVDNLVEETPLDEDHPEDDDFMQGYAEEEEIPTCAECGVALRGKKVSKTIEGEKHLFCSKDCAKDFEESLG